MGGAFDESERASDRVRRGHWEVVAAAVPCLKKLGYGGVSRQIVEKSLARY